MSTLVFIMFQSLLPKGCYRAITYSNCYVESYRCNLLGLPPSISIPPHVNTSEVYLVVDIFDPDPAVMYPGSFVGYRFQVSGSASLDKGIISFSSDMEIYAPNIENLRWHIAFYLFVRPEIIIN